MKDSMPFNLLKLPLPKYFFLFITAGTLLMILVMGKTGTTLKTAATPHGILDLEFAYNSEKATEVINAWQAGNNIEQAIVNTQYDFIFLIFYSIFLFLGCKMVAGRYGKHLHLLGSTLAAGAVLAGILDILENIGMLVTLHKHISNGVTLLTVFFSGIKWILAIFALLYFMLFGSISLLKKGKRESRFLK